MIAIQEDNNTYGKSNQTKKIKSNKTKEEKNKIWQAFLEFKDHCKSSIPSSDTYVDSNVCCNWTFIVVYIKPLSNS